MAGSYFKLLAEHESALAEIYRLFAATLKQSEQFWLILAAEEDSHKHLILDLEAKVFAGGIIFNRPNFTVAAISDSIDWINQNKTRIKNHGITMKEALRDALTLECGIIESAFFNVVDGDDPNVMELLISQSSKTKNHILRLKKEARRLKWKIFGNRRSTPPPAVQPSRDDLKLSVRTYQTAILSMLANLEEAISHLYTAFAQRIPDQETFWEKMAAEEMQHASMIRKLYSVLQNGNIFYNIENFNRRALEDSLNTIMNAEFEARHGTLTRAKAMNIALRIERNLVEKEFYKTVRTDAPEFKVIATRMTDHIGRHIKKIEDEAGRLIDLGSAATESLPLPSQPSARSSGI